jgi:4-amino-4-deoxy-L-arabinose transferase-like glycosyltransferase
MSLGAVAFLIFALWVVNLWDRVKAEYAEKVRRYDEKYPFGEYKSRYERGE